VSSESKLSVETLRQAVKLLKAEPMCMQRLPWIDAQGIHSKFYGHRARLAKKARS
jgi:hypothetical protein